MKIRTKTTKDISLLEQALLKWKENLARSSEPLSLGSHSCPLCWEYIAAVNPETLENDACLGCPIRTYTNRRYCADTPYDDVVDALHEFEVDNIPEHILKEAIQKEIDFLENLLATYKRTKTT